MAIRSMTGYAQVRAFSNGTQASAYAVSLKSVNHRYLDLSMRMPSECDGLEMKLRRLLKEKIARGHVDLTLSIEKGGTGALQFNKSMVGAYVDAFREASKSFGVTGEPDLNAIFKMPGALAGGVEVDEQFEASVLSMTEKAIVKLNEMREEEGRGIERELRQRMKELAHATEELAKLRVAVSRAYLEKIQSRLNELIAGKADQDRLLQEAAILAERSDIQEELVRMKTHISHFTGMIDAGGEIGKKLDFLLQEMNREANTLLSKTAGVSGDGLRITELGLAMKSEIEKTREQIQNIE
ncbi:MAG TPA: YicC/YloC family endoribonuclease [Terriglobales bacterium]|nr:YicC/YloC family endoribonuclease [Terriglobales bacterium]